MEKERLIIRTEIAGTPVRYHVNVTREVADKYAVIRKEHSELKEVLA
ncbi:MAG: hypothetical protein ACP5D9_13515 [Mariniphaga sp.]